MWVGDQVDPAGLADLPSSSSVVTRKKAERAMISQPKRNRMLLRAITSRAMPAVIIP